MEQRKPAKRRAEIPQDILRALSAGHIQTANLVEWLALDQVYLLRQSLGRQLHSQEGQGLLDLLATSPLLSVNAKMRTIGSWLGQHLANQELNALAQHPSDMVRGWVAYAWMEKCHKTDFLAMLHCLKPLANDHHFSVREVAWMAMRPFILKDTLQAIETLTTWAKNKSPNLRRFACEATRPRGVWCAHLPLLRQQPERAEILLSPLRHDPEKYVQLSLGNWLNDAGKTRPDWVKSFVANIDPSKPGTSITLKRALRNLS